MCPSEKKVLFAAKFMDTLIPRESDKLLDDPIMELRHLLSALRELRTTNPRTMRPSATSLLRCLNLALKESCPGSSTDVVALVAVRAGILPVAAFNVPLPTGLVLLRALAFWNGARLAIPTDTAENVKHLSVIMLSLGILLIRIAKFTSGSIPDIIKGLLPPSNVSRSELVLGPDLLHLRPKPSIRVSACQRFYIGTRRTRITVGSVIGQATQQWLAAWQG
jgi:hypothetical protein